MALSRILTIIVVCFLGVLTACTSTQVTVEEELPEIGTLAIGSTKTSYAESLPADRATFARQYHVAERVGRLVEQWMTETGRWGGSDAIHIEVDSLRLPSSMRWATAQAKGNDYLGTQVAVVREGGEVAGFHVEHTIGAGDRSIAENYSAGRTLENLVEAVAWSVAHTLTPFEERRPIFEIGKREQIERAIEMLELCGELSYGESLKYVSLGKISAGTTSGAEARRLKKAIGGKLQSCY